MKKILSLLALILSLNTTINAQVDIENVKANPKTFIFSDEKHTVHQYIYGQLQKLTTCCGNDAIYLEVKFDKSGKVTSVKTLTGKRECYKQSVPDIIYKIKWDATGVADTKTIYFELKPMISCNGSPGENVYKPIAN